jgi:hypothetical protein
MTDTITPRQATNLLNSATENARQALLALDRTEDPGEERKYLEWLVKAARNIVEAVTALSGGDLHERVWWLIANAQDDAQSEQTSIDVDTLTNAVMSLVALTAPARNDR